METVTLHTNDRSIVAFYSLFFLASGQLPEEILIQIFQGLRGNVLIRLTTVCKKFNETIGGSKELMGKIRLKVSFSDDQAKAANSKSFDELDNLLQCSDRKYENLSVYNSQCDNESCLNFMKKHKRWKSLKYTTCHFKSIESKVSFLSTFSDDLEEAEIENEIMDEFRIFNSAQPVLSVNFPKLVKLKCDVLPAEFRCTTLKVFNLTRASTSAPRILQMLHLNRQLEDLTISYEILDAIFLDGPGFFEMGINLRLRKLHIHQNRGIDPIHTSFRNFQTFLKSQSDCLQEVMIEWYSGNAPTRETRRRRAVEFFSPNETICVKALEQIFQDFKVIRKLIVTYKQGFLQDPFCLSRPTSILNLTPNQNIAELRLRFETDPLSEVLFEKLVTASPNVKSLFVHEINQSLLEICSKKLKHLESIFALSFRVDSLPNENAKLNRLRRVNFCECIISNHPELRGKKLFDQKASVLKMLT